MDPTRPTSPTNMPIVSAKMIALPPVDENLLQFHTHTSVCGEHAYAYGSLAHIIERVLQRNDVGPESAADLRAYLAQTARCLIRTRDVHTTDDLIVWAGE